MVRQIAASGGAAIACGAVLAPVVPLMAAAAHSPEPGPCFGLALVSLLPKLAVLARRPLMPQSARDDVATAADIALVTLAARFCTIPDMLAPVTGDLVTGLVALFAGLAWLARRRLAAANASLDGHALAALNHELRTPLNAILGYSGLMRVLPEASMSAPRCQDYARIIEGSAEHMLAVIEAATGAKPATASAALDLDILVAESLELLAPLAATKSITLSYQQPALAMQAVGGYAPFRQILVNLIGNAVKFSPAGSAVEVSVRRQPDGRIEIAVADQGTGIAGADLARLGQPLWRAESTVRNNIEGSGLGLAISRRLAERQGASLAFDSRPGHGTIARVRLPEHNPRRFAPRPLGPLTRQPAQSGTAVNPAFAIGGP